MFDRSSEFQRLAGDLNYSITTSMSMSMKKIRTGSGGMAPPPIPADLESGMIVKSAPLDDFLSGQESVKSSCERIEQLMNEIDVLHRSALVSVDPEDSIKLAKKIEAATVLAASESASVRRLLKSMDEETRALSPGDLSESDLRLRTAKQRSLCKKFMALMEQFEAMQSNYRQKYANQVERQYKLVKPEATEDELAKFRESPQLMSQQVFMLTKKAQASQSLQVMKDKQAEVQKLEKGMQELHEMFLDISFLVSQQGYTIDRVEEYVDASQEATAQAATVMKEAVVKQRRAQRRRWFMAGLGMVILIVLIVIIVLALTNNL